LDATSGLLALAGGLSQVGTIVEPVLQELPFLAFRGHR
jgi:hypothetical protein